MAAPTAVELPLIQKLRENIQDIIQDVTEYQRTDMLLVTWLRARDLDLPKAEDMLRKALIWSREHNFEAALDWVPPGNMRTEYLYEFCGLTVEKCPIILVYFGQWDVKKIAESDDGPATFSRYTQQIIANVKKQQVEQSRIPHEMVTQFVAILDFQGYSFRQLTSKKCIKLTLELIKDFEDTCPEILKSAYVINAPKIFSILFSILKPLLTARTLEKVEIYGSNPASWKPVLARNVPAEQLPLKYGNTMTAELPAEEVPATPNNLTTITVPAGKKVTLEYEISEPDSMLSWTYSTKDYDIGFGVLFEKDLEVYNYEKVEAGKGIQEGMILCEKIGKYTVIFDNSYSRLRSKTVSYSVQKILPGPEES